MSLILSLLVGTSSIFFASCACSAQIEDHSIITTSSNIQKGTVSIGGIYKTNDTVTLSALAKNGYQFISWIKGDLIVSYESEFSFIASRETEGKYTALFTTDELEFFMIKEISYDIAGLEMSDDESSLNKVNFIEIESGTTSGLYQLLGNFDGAIADNTGNFSTKDFSLQEKIFYLDKEYHFVADFEYEYINNLTSTKDKNSLNAKFSIDFKNLNNGEVNGNTKTYTGTNYTITQTNESESVYEINVTYTKLAKPTGWNDESIHSLNIKFSYPFNSDEQQ
jgi:hypothetical protein